MSPEDRHAVAKQTADYLLQLRGLQSDKIQALDNNPVYAAFLFLRGHGMPHGPISSDDELWAELELALSKIPEGVRRRLRERMPVATPYTFNHGDLTFVNIMVADGRVTGLIDWESSGYYPVWWEFAAAGIGLSKGDTEWKRLLQQYMPDFPEAKEFWWDFHSLSRYPEVDERAKRLLDNAT